MVRGGVGRAIARSLKESGCKVIVCGTNEAKLCLIAEEGDYKPQRFNVQDSVSMEANVEKAVKIFGRIDIVVYSAGVHTEKADFFCMDSEEYDRVMAINLKGAYFCCQAFGKYMVQNKVRGHILLVSSSRGSEPAYSPYGISKWGMNGMTKGLAQLLLPYGISVNAIAPGSTATELLGVKDGDSIYADDNVVHRLTTSDEVASVAKMLVCSDMICGEIVHISAGRGTFDIR